MSQIASALSVATVFMGLNLHLTVRGGDLWKFSVLCLYREAMQFYVNTLSEWAWSHVHKYMTTFIQFAQKQQYRDTSVSHRKVFKPGGKLHLCDAHPQQLVL